MLFRQFFAFSFIGGVSTACHFLVLVLLHDVGNVGVVPATSVGAAVGAIVSYVLNRTYTFSESRPPRTAVARFATVAIVGLVINSTAMAVLQSIAPGVNYLLRQCAVTLAVLVYSFALNKYWTFRDRPLAT